VYDNILGLQSRKDFVIKAYLIAGYLRKIEGKYIGIMLPSVASSSLLLIATYLAGKVPVMLNWTVGETALLHCIHFAKIDHVLTSKSFYENIKNNGTDISSSKNS
jgi:long-chain-fatty-acid--[acyl-carrier-protein] ligase